MTPGATVSLKDIVRLADTGTWGSEAVVGAGVPVLRSSNIQNGELSLEDVAWRELPAEQRVTKRLEDGDLIVTMSSGSPAHIGKCCIFRQPPDGRAYYFSNFTLRLRVRSDIADPEWLFHWLSSPAGRSVLDAMNSTTSGLRNLNRPRYLGQKVPLPSLPEQRRIAAILDKADAVRRKRQQTLDLAHQFLRSAFLDMFGDPIANPKGWPTGDVEAIVSNPRQDIRCGPFGTQLKVEEIVSEGTPLLGIENVRGNQFRPSIEKFLTQEKAQDLRRFDAKEGDVLLTRMGTIGHACVVPDGSPEARITYHLFRIRVNQTKCLPGYLAATITRSGTFVRQLERSAHGAIMSGLKSSDLKAVRFLLPPLPIQVQYVELVRRVDASIAYAAQHAVQCSHLSSALTQRAFRGLSDD